MKFNLNQFLLALSDALDFVEIDTLGATSFHTKRVAYIALALSEYFDFNEKQVFDICSYALLHDNGLSEENYVNSVEGNLVPSKHSVLEDYSLHCEIGEENVRGFPFLSGEKNIVKYHHENYDGSGFFGLKGDEIPLMAQIIALADTVDNLYHFEVPTIQNRKNIIAFINNNVNKYYSKELVEAFNKLSNITSFWLDLQSRELEKILINRLPNFTLNLDLERLVKLTNVFTKIIDSNSKFTATHSSGLSEKIELMGEFYGYDSDKILKLIIVANLHDLGKLAIPNRILDKNGKLTDDEFEIIKSHTYYTRQALSKIDGFEEISQWASNHHEKLDGTGYPYGLKAHELEFEGRLLTCLDIYQALTEDRPYRKGMSHEKAMAILFEQANAGLIDIKIVNDINIEMDKS